MPPNVGASATCGGWRSPPLVRRTALGSVVAMRLLEADRAPSSGGQSRLGRACIASEATTATCRDQNNWGELGPHIGAVLHQPVLGLIFLRFAGSASSRDAPGRTCIAGREESHQLGTGERAEGGAFRSTTVTTGLLTSPSEAQSSPTLAATQKDNAPKRRVI